MEFTLTFLKVFAAAIYYVSPILVFLIAVIAFIGQIIGRLEGWTKIDALYFAFITATTVGYGDFRPHRTGTKLASILITLVGILLTGMIVAIGLKAAEMSFHHHYDFEEITGRVQSQLNKR